MGGNPFLVVFEGVGPEIETFLGPEMGTSVASAIRAQKVKRYINNSNSGTETQASGTQVAFS